MYTLDVTVNYHNDHEADFDHPAMKVQELKAMIWDYIHDTTNATSFVFTVSKKPILSHKEALFEIHSLLDQSVWDAQTTEQVAGIMRAAGFTIRDRPDDAACERLVEETRLKEMGQWGEDYDRPPHREEGSKAEFDRYIAGDR